ncbi:MAG TPA: hypothetical protein VMF58_13835 [Rhizomicrobium sp.]|nr:hypothetical protein [Rhizomicrobium sp.]
MLAHMNHLRKIVILTLSSLVLAGCGKRPATHDVAPQQSSMQSSSTSGANLAPATPECSSIPDKIAIQRGIQDAMKSIYGVDEAPAKFVVLRIRPADCEHVTVLYRSQTAGAASQTAQATTGDGGKWFITLFNKPYPLP